MLLQVDFGQFEVEVERGGGLGFDEPAAGRGIEFRRALETTVGKSSSSFGGDHREMSQAELARSLGPQINKLFNDYDSGEWHLLPSVIVVKISFTSHLPTLGRTRLDVFREQLAALGLEETPEVRKVLSQVPIKFTALMRAFAADGVSSSADFVAGGRASKVRCPAVSH
jgi:hypothetical protein